MEYTVDYFIEKFKNIPNELWATGDLKVDEGGACCALGHTGMTDYTDPTEETFALCSLFVGKEVTEKNYKDFDDVFEEVYSVNDGFVDFANKWKTKAKTPKKRILTALKRIKAKV